MVQINLVADMKSWLLECFNEEVDQEEIEGLSFEQLVRAINRYYEGGIEQFKRDGAIC